jgi:hypothetical protein
LFCPREQQIEVIWEEIAEQNILFARKKVIEGGRKLIMKSAMTCIYHKILLGRFPGKEKCMKDVTKLYRT